MDVCAYRIIKNTYFNTKAACCSVARFCHVIQQAEGSLVLDSQRVWKPLVTSPAAHVSDTVHAASAPAHFNLQFLNFQYSELN